MGEFEKLCKTSDIPQGSMKGFTIGESQVLVANVGGNFYALDAVCNHMSGYLPAGELNGKVVTCPVHGCQYDVTTGKVVKNTSFLIQKLTGKCGNQRTFKLKKEKDYVYIEK